MHGHLNHSMKRSKISGTISYFLNHDVQKDNLGKEIYLEFGCSLRI